MKKECWLILTALLSTSLLAQQANNSTAPAPIATPAAAPAVTNAASAAAGTNAPAANAAKKKTKKAAKPAAKKKDPAMELKSVPLVAGPAVVIASKLNVRGRAGLKGEVIGRIEKEQPVTVIEEITLSRSGPDEPSAWAKIMLPTNIHVWVNTSFIEPTNKTVRPKKLNLRGGAGENFSVLGVLKRGDMVKDISTKGDWMEIEAPADAFAFVAAQYLKQEAPAALATTTTEPTPAPTTVPEATPIAAAPTDAPATPPPTTPAPAETPAVTNAPAAETPVVQEPPPPRIVQREGIVRGTFSIQAPTHFELISPNNGRAINYLYSPARDLDLRRYKGLRIIVTGEEGLDERWRNTPIITIQKITVPETGPQPAG